MINRLRSVVGGLRRRPWATTSLALVLLLAVWVQGSVFYRQNLIDKERSRTATLLGFYNQAFSNAINSRLGMLEGLYAFVNSSPSAADLEGEFEQFASGLYSSAPGIQLIAVAPGGVNRYVYPLSGNESALGLNLLLDERLSVRANAERAIQTQRLVVTGPVVLRNGVTGLIVRRAVYKEGQFLALVSLALDMPAILSEAGLNPPPPELRLALRDDQGQVFYGDPTVLDQGAERLAVSLPEHSWTLVGLPVAGWDAVIRSELTQFQVVGLALILLLAMLIYSIAGREAWLAATVEERTRSLQESNRALEAEIASRGKIEETLRLQSQYLDALYETSLGLMRHMKLDELLYNIVNRAALLLGSENGYIYLLDPATDEMELRLGTGSYTHHLGLRLRRGAGLAGRVWQSGKALLVDDYSSWPQRIPDFGLDLYFAAVGAPLFTGKEVSGVLGVARSEPGLSFTPEQIYLLERLAQLASIALENARLQSELERELADRRQAEEELRRSEERSRLISENTADVIWTLDVSTNRFTYISPSVQRLRGYSPAEAMAQSLAEALAPEDFRLFTELLPQRIRAFQAGQKALQVAVNEVHQPCKDGSFVETEVVTTLLTDDRGRVVEVLGVSRDITERKRVQAQLQAAERLSGLGTLAAGIAHELNSPLQVVTGMSESLAGRVRSNEASQEKILHSLEMIRRNGWRCAEIIRSLLNYARPTTGSVQPHDLNALVSDTLLLIEHQLHTWSNIRVKTQLADSLPALVCNRGQVAQALINLLTNARDAMPNGGDIIIRTSFDPADGRILLQVSDSGPGIPAGLRGKVFDPFFTTKPAGQGTGLGLSIVASIAQSHGGEVIIEDGDPRGAVVNLFFPASARPSASPSEEGRYDKL